MLVASDLKTLQSGEGVSEESQNEKERPYKREIVWFNAIGFLVLHLVALYGAFLFLFLRIKWQTWLFSKYLTYYYLVQPRWLG